MLRRALMLMDLTVSVPRSVQKRARPPGTTEPAAAFVLRRSALNCFTLGGRAALVTLGTSTDGAVGGGNKYIKCTRIDFIPRSVHSECF